MRKSLMKIYSTLLIAILAGTFISSCSSDPEDLPGDSYVTLVIHGHKVDGSTRAADNEGIERVEELQIVIINAGDNTIEVNRTIDLRNLVSVEDYLGVFELKGKAEENSDRKIFAIGNPASTGFSFSDYAEGSSRGADLEDALNAHSFTFDASKPIVLTDDRVVPGSDLKIGRRTDVDLKLVRVATKFSVRIINNRFEDVELLRFTVNSLGEQHYLMPHFSDNSGRYIVRNSGLSGFDFTDSYRAGDSFANADNIGMHWSDWMDLAVQESHKHSDESSYTGDLALADFRGWIMKYNIPSTTTGPQDFTLPEKTIINPGKSLDLPTHYSAESKFNVKSSEWVSAANGLEQSYTFDISFKSEWTAPNQEGGGIKTFENQPFRNLRALFRNTHVLMEITINQSSLHCEVRVVPYTGVWLDPGFGIIPQNN